MVRAMGRLFSPDCPSILGKMIEGINDVACLNPRFKQHVHVTERDSAYVMLVAFPGQDLVNARS